MWVCESREKYGKAVAMEITVLVIEDQLHLREYLRKILEQESYAVLTVSSGKDALDLLKNKYPDIILLDLNLGDMDGRDIIKILRRQYDDVPIIVVSSFTEINKKVNSFELGCDDYLTKPFYKDELLVRMKRVYARCTQRNTVKQSPAVEEEIIGPFSLNYNTGQIRKNGRTIDMSNKLFRILLYFIKNKNRIVTKEQLLCRFWQDQENPTENTLVVHIHMLRSLIEKDPSKPKFLITRRGLGYYFKI